MTTETTNIAEPPLGAGSLADGLDIGAGKQGRAGPPRPSAADQLAAITRRLRRDEDMKWVRRAGLMVLALGVVIGGTLTTMRYWPRSAPNFLEDDMDDVLDFALLSQDFNQLPLERRLSLIKDLVQRLKTMSASDSAMMAMFATSIQSKAREQLEENIRQLGVDMLDSYAADYGTVPASEAPEFLDEKIIEFTQLMEELAGENIGLPDDPSERLARLKRQAKREEEGLRRQAPEQMRFDRVTGFVEFLREDSDDTSSPIQRARMTRLLRDMTRHLRGQDVSTGKPPK